MKKVLIIVLTLLFTVGAGAFAFSFFSGAAPANSVTNTHTVNDIFTDFVIDVAQSDVVFAVSENGVCFVECKETDKFYHTVEVENGVLKIKDSDNRKRYEKITTQQNLFEMAITVYLPAEHYKSLSVETVSGSVEMPENFAFESAELKCVSGNINFASSVDGKLLIEETSGDVTVNTVTALNAEIKSVSGMISLLSVNGVQELYTESVSGEVELNSVECNSITVKTTSGDINMNSVVSKNTIEASTVSGCIALNGSDAQSLDIKSVSGDVFGTLLSEKTFIAESSSGNVNVPDSAEGGKCEIETSSGNINVSVQKSF